MKWVIIKIAGTIAGALLSALIIAPPYAADLEYFMGELGQWYTYVGFTVGGGFSGFILIAILQKIRPHHSEQKDVPLPPPPRHYKEIKDFVYRGTPIERLYVGKTGVWLLVTLTSDEARKLRDPSMASEIQQNRLLPLLQLAQDIYGSLARDIGIHCTMHAIAAYPGRKKYIRDDTMLDVHVIRYKDISRTIKAPKEIRLSSAEIQRIILTLTSTHVFELTPH